MKALISPTEVYTHTWVASWTQVGSTWQPIYSSVEGCIKVAQVEEDNNTFEVAAPLYWVPCPENCNYDFWYFKDGQFYEKQQDAPLPLTPVETLP